MKSMVFLTSYILFCRERRPDKKNLKDIST